MLTLQIIRLDPSRAALVGDGMQRLRAAGDEETATLIAALPDGVNGAMEEVIGASAGITRLRALGAASVRLRSLDRVIDRLISAIADTASARRRTLLLDGFFELSEAEAAELAGLTDLDGRLTPDGRSFMNLPYTDQYQKNKELVLVCRAHQGAIDGLNLTEAVDRLELCNQHFGAALGLAEPPPTPLAIPLGDGEEMNTATATFERAVRRYAIGVLHHFDDETNPAHLRARQVLFGPIEQQIEAERQARRDARGSGQEEEPTLAGGSDEG